MNNLYQQGDVVASRQLELGYNEEIGKLLRLSESDRKEYTQLKGDSILATYNFSVKLDDSEFDAIGDSLELLCDSEEQGMQAAHDYFLASHLDYFTYLANKGINFNAIINRVLSKEEAQLMNQELEDMFSLFDEQDIPELELTL